MNASDYVASYAALVSTIVAAFQVLEWQRSRRYLSVNLSPQWSVDGAYCCIVRLSNRGSNPVTLEYVSVGTYRRNKFRPWRILPQDQIEIKETDPWNGRSDGFSLTGRTLEPGHSVYALIEQETLDTLSTEHFLSKGVLSNRRVVSIEHSQNDVPIDIILSI